MNVLREKCIVASMATVTAVIATYNRGPEAAMCVRRLLQQVTPPDEILIVDDCSTDGICELARQNFPSVKRIRLPYNCGYIHARNIGIASATSDYVLLLDDDSWFLEPDGLAKAMRLVESRSDVAIAALNVVSCDEGELWRGRGEPENVATHVGCGALLNRRLVAEAGYYCEAYRSMGEEEDLSLRAWDKKWRTLSLPSVKVYHAQSPTNRSWRRIRYFSHRNAILRELLLCPAPLLPHRVAGTWLSHTKYNLKNRYWTTDLRIALELPRLMLLAIGQRRPVTRQTYRDWIALRRASSDGKGDRGPSSSRATHNGV